MSAVHTLIIKGSGSLDDPSDMDIDYSIECPGVTDSCRMWVGCNVPECPSNTGGDDTLYDVSNVAHGEEHKYIDESWCVPTDTCYLIAADELPDAADYLANQNHLKPGRYEVEHDFDDGRITILILAHTAQAASR